MVVPTKPHKLVIPTLSGQTEVTCPICQNKEFLDSGPPEEIERRGYRHVAVGITGTNCLAYIPVRFKFCGNCGFILQFVIQSKESTDAE